MRQNLVLLTIDCLRADHCGFMGYARPTTPTLDALARESIIFENAQVAGAPTYYSFPAILASRYPLSLGRDVLGIPPHVPTLATILRAAGYHTAGFNAGNPYLSRWFGYDQGFDVYEDFDKPLEVSETTTVSPDPNPPLYRRLNRRIAEWSARVPLARELYNELDFRYCHWQARKKYVGAWDRARAYPNAAEVTQRALTWLATQAKAPFFLWVHYMDPHHPRYPSPQTLSAIGARPMSREHQFLLNDVWRRPAIARRSQRELIDLYDASIREVDDQLALLLKQIRAHEPTALVVLGDHGEEFLEHGRLGHSPPSLDQSAVHVPVMLHSPNSTMMHRVQVPFSLVDLAPTLLTMFGLDIPTSFQGHPRWKNLMNQRPWSEPAISEIVRLPREPRRGDRLTHPRLLAVREARYKLILDLANGADTLYDLRADPLEQHPLAQANEIRRRLLVAAREHLQRTRLRQDDPIRLRARVANLRERLEREIQTAP